MFFKGFRKFAATLVTMSPEEYFALAGEKDPLVGGALGSLAGGVAGAAKGAKGAKSKSALIGAAIGAAGGAGSGHLIGKAIRRYQSQKVRRMAEGLHLKSTPGHKKEE